MQQDTPFRIRQKLRFLTIHDTLKSEVPVAQLDRALASGAKGQRFESSRERHPTIYTWHVEMVRSRSFGMV
jgi:hypothetical protein